MSDLLRPGETLLDSLSGNSCTVREQLGGGGQGEVYRVQFAGKDYAAKWYYPKIADTQLRTRISRLVQKSAPDIRFLWPQALLIKSGNSSFGYLMPLRESRFSALGSVFKRRANPVRLPLSVCATAGLQLSDSFWQLHAKGLCYCDISFGNIFVDLTNGDVSICDNDNVTVDKDPSINIAGTACFMAPEVVRGEARPSAKTDRYSLAIFLFYLLMREHPLHGKKESSVHCMDDYGGTQVYGTAPLFMFDPTDHSNEPHPQYHPFVERLWRLCPSYLRDLFTRSFTTGLRDPEHGRVGETLWRQAFSRWRDTMVQCPACGLENSFDDALGQTPYCCNVACGKPIPLPPVLKLGSRTVTCHDVRKLYPHHLDGSYDFSRPIAEVVPHPKDKTIRGLKNLSTTKWVVTTKDGSMMDIEPGRSIGLHSADRISFGQVVAEIQKAAPTY